MKYLIYLFLILTSTNIQAQDKSDDVSEEEIERYVRTWRLKDGFKYLEALEDAKKVFLIGKKVNQEFLKKHFTTNVLVLMTEELRHNDFQEYLLFSGGNGIIGQAVVLFINKNNRVEKVEIRGWGR